MQGCRGCGSDLFLCVIWLNSVVIMSSLLVKLQIFSDRSFWQKVLHSKSGLVITSVCLGLISTLGYAPWNMWPVSLVALAFEFCFVASLKTRKQVFWSLLMYFGALNTITLEWLNFVMTDFGGLPYLLSFGVESLFGAYLALFHALMGMFAFRLAFQKYQPKAEEPEEEPEDDEGAVEMPEPAMGGSMIPQGFTQNYLFPVLTMKDGQQYRFFKNAFLLCFLPVALIIADFIAGWLFTGFPWMYFGYTVLDGPFTAYVPLIGVRGLTLILFICAGSLALAIERRYIYLPVAGVLFFFGIFLHGVKYTTDEQPVKVAAIQGNIPQAVKWDPSQTMPSIDKYISLSVDHFGKNDIIVWPESAMPVYFQQVRPLLRDMNRYANESETSMIIGMQRVTEDQHSFNSMFLLGQSNDIDQVQYYDKRQLVPFGEVVPFEKYTRQLGSIFNFPMSSFTRGEYNQKQIYIERNNLHLIPALCYESIFPELMSSLHDENTNGIIMISNDSWYGDTRGPQEHLAIAQMRSMEMQKPMIRVTNSGITALIESDGSIGERLETNIEGSLIMSFTPASGMTPFVRFGNIPLAVLLVVLCAIGWRLRSEDQDERLAQIQELIRP